MYVPMTQVNIGQYSCGLISTGHFGQYKLSKQEKTFLEEKLCELKIHRFQSIRPGYNKWPIEINSMPLMSPRIAEIRTHCNFMRYGRHQLIELDV